MPFELVNPEWLFITPALFVLYLLIKQRLSFLQYSHIDRVSLYLPFDLDQTGVQKPGKKTRLLNWIFLFLLSISLAQPVVETRIAVAPEHTKDIFFIIDTSVGMSIKDYSINNQELDRLSLVKALLIQFVETLNDNRTGTMVYAEQAYVLTPLTMDKDLAVTNIKRVRPALAGRRNNLAKALTTYFQYSKTLDSKPTVVVLSQGANLEGSGNITEIVKKFKSNGTRLHFVGLGSESPRRTSSNKLIYDPIDKALLSDLASTTGGNFFWAGNESSLETTLLKIKSSETEYVANKDIVFLQQYYMWPLYAFLLLLLLKQANAYIKRFKQ